MPMPLDKILRYFIFVYHFAAMFIYFRRFLFFSFTPFSGPRCRFSS